MPGGGNAPGGDGGGEDQGGKVLESSIQQFHFSMNGSNMVGRRGQAPKNALKKARLANLYPRKRLYKRPVLRPRRLKEDSSENQMM